MTKTATFVLASLTAVLAAGHARGQAPGATLDTLPMPPGGTGAPVAEACSADGQVVVGHVQASASPVSAAIWTPAGAQLLPGLFSGDPKCRAVDVSADGSRVAGNARNQEVNWIYPRWRACVWVNGLPTDLGSAPGVVEQATGADAISADGSAVAGWVQDPSTGTYIATRFLLGVGAQLLPTLPPHVNGRALDVSADGSVVVGRCWTGPSREGFVWSPATGTIGLGPGSDAQRVTADGSVVAGITPQGELGYWSQATGWVAVSAPVYNISVTGIADDGRRILAWQAYPGGSNAYVWSPNGGLRQLDGILSADYGIGSVDVYDVRGLTADGEHVVGRATVGGQTQAYRLQLERDAWTDLGNPLPGAGGAPKLLCRGSLQPGTTFATVCTGFPSNALSVVVVGIQRVDLPVLGGVLVPRPDVTLARPAYGNAGGSALAVPNLPASASGSSWFVQQWVLDPSGPQGLTASNALTRQVQ